MSDEFSDALAQDAETDGETYHRHGGRAWRHGEPCPYCRIERLEQRIKALEAPRRKRKGLFGWLIGE